MPKFNKQELQILVDDHARIGLQDSQIKTHLRTQHGVALSDLIPPPTKQAQKARRLFFATGVMNTSGMKMGASSMRLITSTKRPPSEPAMLEENLNAAMKAEAIYKLGIPLPTIKITEFHEKSWRESQAVFFSDIYRGTGPTLLDRIIHGHSNILREVGFGPGSNFEVFQERVVSNANKGAFDPAMLPADFAKKWNIHQAIDVSLYPWFKSGCETVNIQIDAEMAEIFMAGKAPSSISCAKEFLTKPVYIDIQEKICGERTVSGIFCRPAPEQGTFSYMAVVEWVNQGYEAFIFGDFGKPSQAVVMHPGDGDDDDEGLTQEVLDAIYDPMTKQIEKIAVMAYMYCRTRIDGRQQINPLTSMPRASLGSTSQKKERNKEKTHSYFRVLRLEIPPDHFGFIGKTIKSWSLDHLVAVTGHFRWQPHGASHSLRKLIWIDAYEKGQGVRHRPAENPILYQVPTTETM